MSNNVDLTVKQNLNNSEPKLTNNLTKQETSIDQGNSGIRILPLTIQTNQVSEHKGEEVIKLETTALGKG